MRKRLALFAIPLIAIAALGACGKSDNAAGPGGVTVGEARALAEAAEMIEQRRPPAEGAPSSSPVPTATANPAS
jgi:hypothetical protein